MLIRVALSWPQWEARSHLRTSFYFKPSATNAYVRMMLSSIEMGPIYTLFDRSSDSFSNRIDPIALCSLLARSLACGNVPTILHTAWVLSLSINDDICCIKKYVSFLKFQLKLRGIKLGFAIARSHRWSELTHVMLEINMNHRNICSH